LTREGVHRALTRLQFGQGIPVIVIKQLPIGYGGQITGRIMGLKLGLALGRKAVFLSDEDPPYVQSLIRPFGGVEALGELADAPLIECCAESRSPIVSFDYIRTWRILQKRGLTVENWINEILRPRFRSIDKWKDYVDGWIFSWLKYVPAFESRLEADRLRLGVDQSTLGVHLRRGDKSVESAYVPAEDYNQAINELHGCWKFDKLFLASDDPQAPAFVRPPSGVELIFDASERRYNNANHKMLMANPELAAEETYIAFKNLRLLAACGGLVGQSNAHFATIVASFVLQRDSQPERIRLIDGRIAERRSVSLRLTQAAKRNVRAMMRQIVPRSVVRCLNRVMYRQ
jgi:hypothetical protein